MTDRRAGSPQSASLSGRAVHEAMIAELERHLARYAQSGSEEAIAKQHAKRKLTVQERLDVLFDPGRERFEIATFAAMGIYEEHGDILSAGVRTVIGSISGRDAIVVANDSMVKSGTWFPLTITKILRAQEIALENRLPMVYLVDSGGLFLPLQSESFPGRDHAGRIFFNNARLSAL
ncbi:MAG TPA: carboxyl transferase domain-containing protein, partial [Planctomycetota bacterium]|nr:carboxyl transferase domain-containing protein [Planctomycetota bacterium]